MDGQSCRNFSNSVPFYQCIFNALIVNCHQTKSATHSESSLTRKRLPEQQQPSQAHRLRFLSSLRVCSQWQASLLVNSKSKPCQTYTIMVKQNSTNASSDWRRLKKCICVDKPISHWRPINHTGSTSSQPLWHDVQGVAELSIQDGARWVSMVHQLFEDQCSQSPVQTTVRKSKLSLPSRRALRSLANALRSEWNQWALGGRQHAAPYYKPQGLHPLNQRYRIGHQALSTLTQIERLQLVHLSLSELVVENAKIGIF